MKRIIFILFFLLSFISVWGQDYYDTDPTKYEAPGDATQYYVLGIFRIGSDPGGWENRNTFKLDSLVNALVTYTDTSQLYIRNDTLFIQQSFLQSAIDTLVYDSLNLIYLNYVNTLPGPAHKEGRVAYDSTSHSLIYFTEEPDVTMNMGRELWVRIFNNTASTITNGMPVYPTGAVTGGWGTVAPAQADSDATSNVIGIATHDIETMTFGYITYFGDVRGATTTGLVLGATAYVSATTPGGLVTTVPDAPNNAIPIGGVTVVGGAGVGAIFARVERFNPINGEAAIGFQDSAYIITPIVTNTWYQITNAGNNLFTYNADVGHDVTLSGDTVYCIEAGVYEFIMSFSFAGANGGVWEFATKQNGTFVPNAKAVRKTGTADVGNVGYACKPRLTANSPVTFWIRNTGNTVEPTLVASTIIIRQVR